MHANVAIRTITFDKNKLLRRAMVLAWFTVAYNIIEGIVSVIFGASDDSIALFGFGVDSFIEVLSAFLVIWRFKSESKLVPALSKTKETRASYGISILFLALALVISLSSAFQLIQRTHPTTTLPGVIISTLSLSFMFSLWRQKLQLAERLDSLTLRSDAGCSLACIKLSAVLFIGSLVFYVMPILWWADSVAALILSFFIFREGLEIYQNTREGKVGSCCGCD